ncbi:MAG: hypothetical protein ACYC1U_11085 [Candidatus Aquicultorales bacterium]
MVKEYDRKPITYFEAEGKTNLSETIRLAVERSIEESISSLVVFSALGEGPAIALDLIEKAGKNIKLIAVTYRAGSTWSPGEGEEDIPLDVPGEIQDRIESSGGVVVRGSMPFREILVPWSRLDPKLIAIKETLKLISGGLPMCIEAILMACDAGAIEEGERIVAASADTSVVALAAHTESIFFDDVGLEISEIICKPSRLTFTRADRYSPPSEEDKGENI